MKILCLGSPMVDIIIHVNEDFLIRHNMKPDEAYVKHIDQGELENFHREIRIGGSITNTCRLLKWICGAEVSIGFMGAIGDDSNGEFIRENLKSLNCFFTVKNFAKTDKCNVFLHNNSRTLCTELGASLLYNLNDLLTPQNTEFINQSNFIYFSAFFLEISTQIIEHVLTLNHSPKIIFNLGASFVIEKYFEVISTKVLPKIDLIFGNLKEFLTLGKVLKFSQAKNNEILLKISSILPKNAVMVVTNAEKPLKIIRETTIKQFPIPEAKIKDTNGAGDAFVAGFLSKYMKQSNMSKIDLNECTKCAIWAAKDVIENTGSIFDRKNSYFKH